MESIDSKGRRSTTYLLLLVLAPFLVYATVLFHCYAFQDDYPALDYGQMGWHQPFKNLSSRDGRPLLGLLFWLFAGWPQSIAQLAFVRLLAVLGIAVWGVALFRLTQRAGYSHAMALGFGLLAISTPSMGVYAAWTCNASFIFGSLGSLLAGALAWRTFQAEGNWKPSGAPLGCSSLLVFLSLNLYQPVAFFFFLPVLLLSFKESSGRNRQTLTTAFLATVQFFVVLAIYYAVFQLIVLPHATDDDASPRAKLAMDLVGKLVFFVTDLLWRGFTSWTLFLDQGWQIATVLVVSGISLFGVFDFREEKRCSFRPDRALIGFAALVLSVFPCLAVAEKNNAFRVLPVLYCVVAALFVNGVQELGFCLRRFPIFTPLPVTLLALAAIGSTTGAYLAVWNGMVRPQEAELKILRGVVNSFVDVPTSIIFIHPQGHNPKWSPIKPINEYGFASSWLTWVPEPLFNLLLREKWAAGHGTRNPPSTVPVLILDPGDIGPDAPALVVDGSDLIDSEKSTIASRVIQPGVTFHHSYWGDLTSLPNGRVRSPWFGEFDDHHFPDIRHQALGRLTCLGKDDFFFKFQDRDLGTMLTSAKTYPSFYLTNRNIWIIFKKQSGGVRFFYDLTEKKPMQSPFVP